MGYLPDPPERDPITGQKLTGHEDEPVRVVIEELLLGLGYETGDITVEPTRDLQFEGGTVTVKADLLVSLAGRPGMVIRCAPGSWDSRIQETIARARLIRETWVPWALATNGIDGALIRVADSCTVAKGIEAILDPAALKLELDREPPHHPNAAQTEKALRVYQAYATFKCPTECLF